MYGVLIWYVVRICKATGNKSRRQSSKKWRTASGELQWGICFREELGVGVPNTQSYFLVVSIPMQTSLLLQAY